MIDGNTGSQTTIERLGALLVLLGSRLENGHVRILNASAAISVIGL